jgi:TetR/AcrR family transcriptional regulator, tetracycline repressor protein
MKASQMEETERPRLSKAAVVQRGLAIGDGEGLEAVTIRRLAADLGVTPMALYWHFRNKDELLAGLADRLWSEIDVDVDLDLGWLDQLRGLLKSLVQVLRAHPAATGLLLEGEKRTSEAAEVAIETTLEVLHRGGFNPQYAATIARSALFTGIMLVMSEPGNEPGMSEAERLEHQRQMRIKMALLPPDRFPRTIEAAGPLTACDDPEFHYGFGIDMFIAGVRAMAAEEAAGGA